MSVSPVMKTQECAKLPQYLEERKAMLEVGSEGTFLTRLQAEHFEMTQRTLRLTSFINTAPFYQLNPDDQTDLVAQHGHMQNYLSILANRLNRIHKVLH